MSAEGDYSEIADQQLDALQGEADSSFHNAILDAGELILQYPEVAQRRSTAVSTANGVFFRLPVAGFPPYKVFWSSAGPRIEAVFPHP